MESEHISISLSEASEIQLTHLPTDGEIRQQMSDPDSSNG